MQYQDCTSPAQPADEPRAGAAADARRLADANINPATGLATDYLNHFNEAIMLLEMLSSCPDCLADFLTWRPVSYRQHFSASRFAGRELAIAAYDAANPDVRERLDTLAGAMNGVLEATRAALASGMPEGAAGDVAGCAAALLRSLAARTGAVINGNADATPAGAPQAVIDGLMQA